MGDNEIVAIDGGTVNRIIDALGRVGALDEKIEGTKELMNVNNKALQDTCNCISSSILEMRQSQDKHWGDIYTQLHELKLSTNDNVPRCECDGFRQACKEKQEIEHKELGAKKGISAGVLVLVTAASNLITLFLGTVLGQTLAGNILHLGK